MKDDLNNIQLVADAFLCSGCGACSAICPRKAISLEFSNLGRLYASVTRDKCIACGLCKRVCSAIDTHNIHSRYKDDYVGNIISVKVGKSSNLAYLKNAQSGGATAEILGYLFETNRIDAALVTRMTYGDIPSIKAVIITSKDEIVSCQKSCYTPVALLEALRECAHFQSIAVVGLPCHIQGTLQLSEECKQFRNITYRIGLICDRTLCAGIMPVMKRITDYQCPIKIDWRRKDFVHDSVYYSYKEAPVVVYTENGQEHVLSNQYRFALKDFFTSPRCRVCSDKLNLHADIVLGDPWGMAEIDWDHGESLILTRTQKGEALIQELESRRIMTLTNHSVDEVLLGQNIHRRKMQIPHYRYSLSLFSNGFQSYLNSCELKSFDHNQFDNSIIEEIQSFIDIERKSSDEITDYAYHLVRKQMTKIGHSKNRWYIFLSRIKAFLLKVIQ